MEQEAETFVETSAPLPPPTAPRGVRWLACLTLASCGFTAVLLAAVSSSSASWNATTEWRQSVQFLQQSAPSLGSDVSDKAPREPSVHQAYTPAAPEQRGVIMCLHDGIVSMGASLIRELRCLGNDERIQVYHCFNELSEASRAMLTRNDSKVEIIDVCTELLRDPKVFNGHKLKAETFQGYWVKPLALYHTNLEEVILLDADDVLMQDPAHLRTTSTGYARTGTIFFHDRITFMRKFFNNELSNGKQMLRHILDTFDYARFGIQDPKPSPFLLQSFAYKQETGHEMDSSMVFIDKRRAGKALDVLLNLMLELRFKYAFSWGDKEAFWLAYELAQVDYFFSPWGLSLIDSVPNKDLVEHPDSLCGSMAHFVPTENAADDPVVLYVNGKVLMDPFAVGIEKLGKVKNSRLFNVHPTRVTPRYNYTEFDLGKRETFECIDKLGSTPLPDEFQVKLLRRRFHYFAAETGVLKAFDKCDV